MGQSCNCACDNEDMNNKKQALKQIGHKAEMSHLKMIQNGKYIDKHLEIYQQQLIHN